MQIEMDYLGGAAQAVGIEQGATDYVVKQGATDYVVNYVKAISA